MILGIEALKLAGVNTSGKVFRVFEVSVVFAFVLFVLFVLFCKRQIMRKKQLFFAPRARRDGSWWFLELWGFLGIELTALWVERGKNLQPATLPPKNFSPKRWHMRLTSLWLTLSEW